MRYEQPRVPELRDGGNTYMALRELIRFLKGFCLAVWRNDCSTEKEISDLEKRVRKLEGGE
jgi:hypothetical protein